MPLHEWSALPGWDGVHQVWIVELLYYLQPRLPAGYRAYIGTTPTFAIGAPSKKRPDVGVRNWLTEAPPPPPEFIAFTDKAKDMHFSTERFLMNQLRKRFGFEGTPIVIKSSKR